MNTSTEVKQENTTKKEQTNKTSSKESQKKVEQQINNTSTETQKKTEQPSNNVNKEAEVKTAKAKESSETKSQNTQETKQTTSNENKQTSQTEIPKCTESKHMIKAGNTSKWFNTKAEAQSYYQNIVNKLSKQWENGEISDEQYNKECPTGFEVYSCALCGKWTLNMYYR